MKFGEMYVKWCQLNTSAIAIYIVIFKVCKFRGVTNPASSQFYFWISPALQIFADFMSVLYQACCACEMAMSMVWYFKWSLIHSSTFDDYHSKGAREKTVLGMTSL